MKSSNWFLKYWYFLLTPAFICAAGTQWTTTLPSAAVGFACAFGFVYLAVDKWDWSFDKTKWYTKAFVFVVVPISIVFIVAGFSDANRHISIFRGADLNNPYLDNTKNFWRAVISGIGGVFVTLVTVGVTKLISSNKRTETKSIDDVRIKTETDGIKPPDDDKQI